MSTNKRSIFYAGSLAAALLLGSVSKWEGVRYTAYRDLVGVPTICYGETKNVKMGMKMTPEQCDALLEPRLKGFEKQVLACTTVTLPEKTQAAFVHFAYNLGAGAYCGNPAKGKGVAHLVNKGKLEAACDKLLEYNKARVHKGKPLVVVKGLTNRRKEERHLCLAGVKEGVNGMGYTRQLIAWISQSFTG